MKPLFPRTRLNLLPTLVFIVFIAALAFAFVLPPDAFDVSSITSAGNGLSPSQPIAPLRGGIPVNGARSANPWAGCAYRVQYGDNLFRIGLRYGVSYTYLAAVNGVFDPNVIYAGMSLFVPCGSSAPVFIPPRNCAPSQTYTVVPGDNLFRIALNYGTSINLLRSANGLYGRVLRPGMQLTVPCPGSVKYREVPTPTPTSETIVATETLPAPTPIVQFVTATPRGSANTTVSMEGSKFIPDDLSIKVGTRVKWTNNEATDVKHTVTSGVPGSPSGIFDSGPTALSSGQSFSFQFNEIGIYAYFSRGEPAMTGKITVNP